MKYKLILKLHINLCGSFLATKCVDNLNVAFSLSCKLNTTFSTAKFARVNEIYESTSKEKFTLVNELLEVFPMQHSH